MVNPADIGKVIVEGPKRGGAAAGGVLRKVLDLAIDGYSGLPGAREAAVTQLQKKQDREGAIEALTRQHIAMAGAQGFATNLGGLATLAVSIPANMAGVMVIQSRLVAAIAHLRGYDLSDNRVRSAVLMCLLGDDNVTALIESHDLPSTPMGIATAPVFDRDLDKTIAEKVLGQLMAQMSGKKVSLLFAKRVPLIGGVVGAGTDGWSTLSIARYASDQFVVRGR
ncbi:EcsC family protein [Aestuariimicrobium ganziense]|uniref:EcsC family protein n=1 Tax=Aestuariimicrobium ganziense TaxID=2773677 RepID=UPI0019442E56|nr:EcsC family protein [Aestuariimicrobium ganziense]